MPRITPPTSPEDFEKEFRALMHDMRSAHQKQLLSYQIALAARPPNGALGQMFKGLEYLLLEEMSEGQILEEAQAILDSGTPDAVVRAAQHWTQHGPRAHGVPYPDDCGGSMAAPPGGMLH